MTPEALRAEQARFNELSPERAKEIATACEGAEPAMRSCWYCNPAHEHLREIVFYCFACGISYVLGYPAAIIGMRIRHESITDDVMTDFNRLLEAAE